MSKVKKKKDLLRTGIARGIQGEDSGIDRENEIIRGFAVVTKGVTFDKRGEFDDAELDKIVKLGNASKIGIKSRFGHPNISTTALGTFLGRIKNYRRDGDIVRADLHIDKTAHDTPNGDLAAYVMDLAESDPDAFGSSMVIDWEPEFQYEEGNKPKKDEKGEEVPPFIRVRKLWAVDVVDDPAANNSMFGMPFFTEDVKFSAEAARFFDKFLNYPDAVEKTISFLQRYLLNRVDIDEEGRIEGKVDNNSNKKEVVNMELNFKEITLEQLSAERPDLISQIQGPAKEEGVTAERARAFSVVKHFNEFKGMGMEDILVECIEKGESPEGSLAKFQSKRLEDLTAASPQNPGPSEDEAHTDLDGLSVEEKAKVEYEKSSDLQKEFGKVENYIAFKKNEDAVKILEK